MIPFIFKQSQKGTSKTSGRPYHIVELHDPNSLENVKFFLPPESTIDTSSMIFKDKVSATIQPTFKDGKIEQALVSLKKS